MKTLLTILVVLCCTMALASPPCQTLSSTTYGQTLVASGSRNAGTYTLPANGIVLNPNPSVFSVCLTALLTASGQTSNTLNFTMGIQWLDANNSCQAADSFCMLVSLAYTGAANYPAKLRDGSGNPWTARSAGDWTDMTVRGFLNLPAKTTIGFALTCFDIADSKVSCQ